MNLFSFVTLSLLLNMDSKGVVAHEGHDHGPHGIAMSDEQINLLNSILENFQYFSTNIRDLPGLMAQLRVSFGDDLGQTLINVLSLGLLDNKLLQGLFPNRGAISDMPSDVPSDMPSLMPSDAPSMVPSDTPSISPKFWNSDWDPSDESAPRGFVSCGVPGGTQLDDDSPRLTVLYGYRIELEPDELVTPAVQTIEDAILGELLTDLCTTPEEGALAISHTRDDKPGGTCLPFVVICSRN